MNHYSKEHYREAIKSNIKRTINLINALDTVRSSSNPRNEYKALFVALVQSTLYLATGDCMPKLSMANAIEECKNDEYLSSLIETLFYNIELLNNLNNTSSVEDLYENI